jgi:CAAX prenyl protease-like protein
VPIIEEVFWRSFVYRFVANLPFDCESLGRFVLRAFLLTSVFFGLEHREWLAGILCGFAYQGLVIRKRRLGDAIVAHAITNLLLGAWVVWRGAWRFW